MSTETKRDNRGPDRRQRRDTSDDAPGLRPDDEVPANRQEDPRRRNQDDEQERRDRRGS